MLDIKIKFFFVIILSAILFYINRKNPTPAQIDHPTPVEPSQQSTVLIQPAENDSKIVEVKIAKKLNQIHKPKKSRKKPPANSHACYFQTKLQEFNKLIAQITKPNFRKLHAKGYQQDGNRPGQAKQINPGVVWCVVGLLIISLVAAIVDFVVTKTNSLKKQGSIDASGRPSLTRRCSLASLTVSRHERRQAFASRRSSTTIDYTKKGKDSPGNGPGVGTSARSHTLRVKFVT